MSLEAGVPASFRKRDIEAVRVGRGIAEDLARGD
jgi:hypothetical protein